MVIMSVPNYPTVKWPMGENTNRALNVFHIESKEAKKERVSGSPHQTKAATLKLLENWSEWKQEMLLITSFNLCARSPQFLTCNMQLFDSEDPWIT